MLISSYGFYFKHIIKKTKESTSKLLSQYSKTSLETGASESPSRLLPHMHNLHEASLEGISEE